MPHLEIKHSPNITFDAAALFQAVEDCLNDHDPSSGACKGRAYAADQWLHSHFLAEVSCLAKPHRGPEFTAKVTADLEKLLKSHLSQPCYFTLNFTYSSQTYITNDFVP